MVHSHAVWSSSLTTEDAQAWQPIMERNSCAAPDPGHPETVCCTHTFPPPPMTLTASQHFTTRMKKNCHSLSSFPAEHGSPNCASTRKTPSEVVLPGIAPTRPQPLLLLQACHLPGTLLSYMQFPPFPLRQLLLMSCNCFLKVPSYRAGKE